MGTTTSSSEPTTPVLLHVYKPKDKNVPQIAGFGIYHTGIEVYGAEYVFAGGQSTRCGVFSQRPKLCPAGSDWEYFKTVQISDIAKSKLLVKEIIQELKQDYASNTYDLVAKNCNHWSEELSKRLTGKSIPGWVNRAAKIGNMVANLLPEESNKEDEKQEVVLKENVKLVENIDLLKLIQIEQVGCLNQSADHRAANIFMGPQKSTFGFGKAQITYLESDADEQLLIYIPFKRSIKLHSILYQAQCNETAPKTIMLFVNQRSLDFNDVTDMKPTQTIVMNPPNKPEDADETEPYFEQLVELQFIKFQKVDFLTIFIEDNFGDDVTRLSRLICYGRTE